MQKHSNIVLYRNVLIGLLMLLLAPLPAAQADNQVTTEQHVIHYNALSTTFLEPQTARAAGIQRSRYRAMLTVAILERTATLPAKSVAGQVSAQATNQNDQLKQISMRRFNDGQAIYFLGDFPIEDKEQLTFELTVTPPGEASRAIQFEQQFFID